jgi:hypothetical protein
LWLSWLGLGLVEINFTQNTQSARSFATGFGSGFLFGCRWRRRGWRSRGGPGFLFGYCRFAWREQRGAWCCWRGRRGRGWSSCNSWRGRFLFQYGPCEFVCLFFDSQVFLELLLENQQHFIADVGSRFFLNTVKSLVMKGFHDGVQTNVKFLCYLDEFSCHAVFFPALLKIF